MFRNISIVVVLFMFFSCSHRENGKVIPKEVMVPVLVDIHLAEAKVSGGSPFEGGKSLKVISDYGEIFNKYNVSPDDFYTSFNYYRAHPAEMDTLYEKVINELTKRESEVNKKTIDKGKSINQDSSGIKKPKLPAGEP